MLCFANVFLFVFFYAYYINIVFLENEIKLFNIVIIYNLTFKFKFGMKIRRVNIMQVPKNL